MSLYDIVKYNINSNTLTMFNRGIIHPKLYVTYMRCYLFRFWVSLFEINM